MKKAILFFFTIFVIINGIVLNILVIKLIKYNIFIPFINILIFLILFIVLIYYFKYKNQDTKKISQDFEQKLNKSKLEIDKQKKLSDKGISIIVELKDFLKKISEFTISEDNNKQLYYVFNDIDKNLFYKDTDKKIEIIDNILKLIDYNRVTEILNDLNKFNLFAESAYKIIFLNKLLSHSVNYTEKATVTLIEKFDMLSTDIFNSNKDTQENLKTLQEGIKGKSFKDVINESNSALKEYDNLLLEIINSNKSNVEKIEKFSDWINKIYKNINNIKEISEKNNIIAINSSIEAAKLGEAGKGFRILSNEIRDLNSKVNSFTNEIKNIMNGFMTFNKTIVNELSAESKLITGNIKETSKRVQQIMFMLIYSYNILSGSFESTTECSNKLEKHLSEVLISMQFQDITRQQIESVIDVLNNIKIEILDNQNIFKSFEFNSKDRNETLFDKAREYILKNIKHFDMDKIKKELEEEKI